MVNERTGHVVLVDFDLALRRPAGGAAAELAPWRDLPLDEQRAAAAAFAASDEDHTSPSGSRRGSMDHQALTQGRLSIGSAPEGCARRGGPDAEAQRPAFAGTAEYAAPEVVAGCAHGAAADLWQVGVLLFELLFGVTPFRGSYAERTFHNVCNARLDLPPDAQAAAADLLRAMLARTRPPSDPRVRLGGLGAKEVRAHAFFEGICWESLPWAAPPVLVEPVRLRGSSIDLADMAHGFED